MRRIKTFFRFLIYDISRLYVFLHIFIFIRPKYIYEDHQNKTRRIPRDKPVIIISNHKHWLDIPVMMTVFLTSRPRFVVAKEVKNKGLIMRFFLFISGCFVIDRDVIDFDNIKTIAKATKQGHNLMIFPEGKLTIQPKTYKFKKGVALMAILSGADILPVYTSNYKWFKRTKVVIGKTLNPLKLSGGKINSEGIDDLTKELESKLLELRRMSYD